MKRLGDFKLIYNYLLNDFYTINVYSWWGKDYINRQVNVKLGNQERTYSLSDILGVDGKEGNFYVEGKELSGSGLGYGVEGEKIVYPEISFKLKIAKEESSSSGVRRIRAILE